MHTKLDNFKDERKKMEQMAQINSKTVHFITGICNFAQKQMDGATCCKIVM